MAVKTKYKDERQKTKVLLFVEGDTDVLFFRSLMEYYRAHSETPVQPYTICNMKGVTRYSSRLKAKLQNEYLPAASAEGVKITAVCCSYDTDVFVRNPQLVDWKAIGKMVDRVGAQFTQVGVEQMIEDWILDDLEGVCRYLRLKDVPTSLPGRNGFERLQSLFRKAGRDYTKGTAAADLIAALDMGVICKKRSIVLARLESVLK